MVAGAFKNPEINPVKQRRNWRNDGMKAARSDSVRGLCGFAEPVGAVRCEKLPVSCDSWISVGSRTPRPCKSESTTQRQAQIRNIPRRREKPQSLSRRPEEGVNCWRPPQLIYTERWPVGGTRDWAITRLTIRRKEPERRKEWTRARPKANFTQPLSDL